MGKIVDEQLLKSKFGSYKVPYNEGIWNNLENQLNEVKIGTKINLPKVNLKFIIFPILIVGIASIIYLNKDKLFSPKQEPIIQTSAEPVKQAETPKENTAPIAIKIDSAVIQHKADSIFKAQNLKKEQELQAAKLAEETKAKEIIEQKPEDTTSIKNERKSEPSKKKKKKRRRNNSNNTTKENVETAPKEVIPDDVNK